MGLLHASRVQRKINLGILSITAAETLNSIRRLQIWYWRVCSQNSRESF